MTSKGHGNHSDEFVGDLLRLPYLRHDGDRRNTPVHRPKVEAAQRLVRESGVCAMLARWRAEDGYDAARGGRPGMVTAEQVLVGLVILALEHQPLYISRLRDLICYRLTTKGAAAFGLDWRPAGRRRDHDERAEAVFYERLWRAARRLIDVIDPYPETPKRRRIATDTMEALKAGRDRDFVIARLARSREVNNALVWASVVGLRTYTQQGWDGTVVVDGTLVLAASRGTSTNGKRTSSEPDAGWWTREHDERDQNPPSKTQKWGWDLTIASMASPFPTDAFPRQILGMSLDKPGHRPAENVITCMTKVLAADVVRGYFVGDRLYYPMQKPENLQLILRQAGYKIVGSMVKGTTGIQAKYKGATQVDGNWYCPAIPQPLVEATTQQHLGQIDDETWKDRIDRRARYLLRPKEAPRQNGSQQFMCPASGPGATCHCPLKARTGDQQTRLTTIPARDVPDHPDKICTNTRALTIPIEAGAKYAQQGPQWGTEEWHAYYTHPRETIESRNAELKSGRGELLGDNTRRALGGIAAQGLLIALLIVSFNVRNAQSHLQRAQRGDPTPRAATTRKHVAPPVSPADLLAAGLSPPVTAA